MHIEYPPPLGYVQPEGQQTIGPEDWRALVERGLQFAPYDGAARLSSVRGDCLEPLIVAGRDRLLTRAVEPGEALVDGTLYSIAWANSEEVQAYRVRIGISATEPITIVKVLKFHGGEWWAMCKDSMSRLDGEVTGQVVGVVPAHSETIAAHYAAELGINAASQMVSNFSAATVNVNSSIITVNPVNQDIITASFTSHNSPVAIDVGATVAVTGGGTINDSCTTCILDVFMDGVSIGSAKWDGKNYMNYGGGTSPAPIQVTLSATNFPATGAHTFALHCTLNGTGTIWNGTVACTNNFIKIREIRR